MGLRRRSYLTEKKKKKKSGLQKYKEKHGIVGQKQSGEHFAQSIGFSEKEQKWYGWSHRAIFGFGVGDKIFKEKYGDEHTKFKDHGEKPIKNMEDAKKAAMVFARYVS